MSKLQIFTTKVKCGVVVNSKRLITTNKQNVVQEILYKEGIPKEYAIYDIESPSNTAIAFAQRQIGKKYKDTELVVKAVNKQTLNNLQVKGLSIDEMLKVLQSNVKIKRKD